MKTLHHADEVADANGLVEWKIQSVREAISQDWITLSAKNLPADKRKAIREHLGMNVAALRDLREIAIRQALIPEPLFQRDCRSADGQRDGQHAQSKPHETPPIP